MLHSQIAERLRIALGQTNIVLFAKKAGISKTWIYDILKGEPASIAIISTIAENLGYNWRWLVTGEGMPSEQWEQTTALVPRLALLPKKGRSKELKQTGQHMLLATQLLDDLGIAPVEAAIFTVSDNDMSPVLNLADDALIHLAEQRLSQGNLFLIGIGSRTTIRRAFSEDGGVNWLLTAERGGIQPILVSARSRCRVLGRVRWIGHRL